MDVFAVRTYFNAHVLSFFETLLRIEQPCVAMDDNKPPHQQQQQQQRPDPVIPTSTRLFQQSARGGGRDALADGEEQKVTDDGDNGGGREFYSSTRGSGNGGVGRGGGGRGHGPWGNNDANNGGKSATCAVGDGGGGGVHKNDIDDSAANPGRCQFAHLRVGASFNGKTYGELVRHVISKGAMPLGLYRPAGTKGSTLAYTHLNPAPHEVLKAWPPNGKATGEEENKEREEEEEEGKQYVLAWGEKGRVGLASPPGALRGQQQTRGRQGGKRRLERTVGDDVFVLRSHACELFGEVSLHK